MTSDDYDYDYDYDSDREHTLLNTYKFSLHLNYSENLHPLANFANCAKNKREND
jgi:hypothetical protein